MLNHTADFQRSELRPLARTTNSANQECRLLALAEIYDGGSRGDATRIGDRPSDACELSRFQTNHPEVQPSSR